MHHLQSKNIRKGLTKWNHKKLYDFIHSANHHQISFIREIMHQKISGKPSPHYGVMIPYPGKIDKNTLHYIHQHSSYSRSHFADAIANNHKAAGAFGNIGKWISEGASTIGSWGKSAMKYAEEYVPKITKYANIAADVAGVTGGVGQMLGLWDEGVAKTIGDVSKGIKDFTKKYEPAAEESGPAKEGGGMYI